VGDDESRLKKNPKERLRQPHREGKGRFIKETAVRFGREKTTKKGRRGKAIL